MEETALAKLVRLAPDRSADQVELAWSDAARRAALIARKMHLRRTSRGFTKIAQRGDRKQQAAQARQKFQQKRTQASQQVTNRETRVRVTALRAADDADLPRMYWQARNPQEQAEVAQEIQRRRQRAARQRARSGQRRAPIPPSDDRTRI